MNLNGSFHFIYFFFQFLLLARIFSHIFIGVIFGYLYMNVGNSATSVLGNYVYLYGSTLLLVYTGKMAVVMTCKCLLGISEILVL